MSKRFSMFPAVVAPVVVAVSLTGPVSGQTFSTSFESMTPIVGGDAVAEGSTSFSIAGGEIEFAPITPGVIGGGPGDFTDEVITVLDDDSTSFLSAVTPRDGASFLAIAGAGAGGAASGLEITFNTPATNVSFFAINAGNGLASISVFDTAGGLIDSASVTASSRSFGVGPDSFAFDFDGGIGSITIVNPGPASPDPNPPYITLVEDFTGTFIPEPASLALLGLGLAGLAGRRRA